MEIMYAPCKNTLLYIGYLKMQTKGKRNISYKLHRLHRVTKEDNLTLQLQLTNYKQQ